MSFCGHPQPLWYIGTHHVNDEFWRPVLLYIASMSTHGLFDLAIRELLCWGEGKPDAVSVWEVLCRTTDKATMQTLFEALLTQTIVNSIAPLAPHWWLVVRSPHAPLLRANWAKMVADEIEAIGCSKNTGIVLSQIPEAFEHLPGEKFLYGLFQFVAESERLGMKDDPKVQESIAAHARVLLKKDPPREHEMLDVLITLVEKGGGSSSPGDDPVVDPVLDAARTRRRDAIDKGRARRRALSVDGPPPPEWHYSYLENG